MGLAEVIAAASQGDAAVLEVIKDIVGGSIDADMASTAAHNYDEDPAKYTGADAVKTLSDDTFSDYKGFILRGKIQFGADIAYSVGSVRSYFRDAANKAAAAEIASKTP